MVIEKSLKMKIEDNLARIELEGKFKGIFNIPVNINTEKYKLIINLSTQKGNISKITLKPEKEFPIIKSKLWKEYFWSRSFLVLSVGGASIEVIKKYIQGQGGENENS